MPTTLSNRFHNFHFTVPGSHISAKALFCAAFAAGAVFLVLMLAMAPLMGASPWAPTRLIAAITMGREALSPPDTFDSGAVSAAIIIHFALSVVYAVVFAFIAKGRSLASDTLLGAAFGLALYVVNFYGFTFLFPWFAEARHWVTITAHLAFGAALGASYAWAARRYPPPR